MFYNSINKELRLFSFPVILLLFFYSNVNSQSLTHEDYKNAYFHMSRDLYHHYNDIIISQEWNNEKFLHYRIKKKNKISSLKIDLTSLEISDYKKRNLQEFNINSKSILISPTIF